MLSNFRNRSLMSLSPREEFIGRICVIDPQLVRCGENGEEPVRLSRSRVEPKRFYQYARYPEQTQLIVVVGQIASLINVGCGVENQK